MDGFYQFNFGRLFLFFFYSACAEVSLKLTASDTALQAPSLNSMIQLYGRLRSERATAGDGQLFFFAHYRGVRNLAVRPTVRQSVHPPVHRRTQTRRMFAYSVITQRQMRAPKWRKREQIQH
jgi:hypothetical protein